MNKNSRIYVAGHRGLVGDAVLRHLRANGYTNILTKTHTELDLTDPVVVRWFFSSHEPEYVFLCAAHVGGILANDQNRVEFLTKNLAIQNNVILSAAAYGVKKLLFLGSSCIYPKNAEQPIKPNALLTGAFEPTTEAYGIAKVAGIRLCQYLRDEQGCNFIAAQPCNLYGPNDRFDSVRSHVVPGLITRLHRAKSLGMSELDVWGDGSAQRELLYADDLASALLLLMHAYDGREVVNAGSSDEWTIKEIADEVRRVVGYRGVLFFDDSKPTGVSRKVLDNSFIRSLGWTPQVSFPEGLEKTYTGFLQRTTLGS
jgi:GDP-L-fucose synthase